MRRRLAPLALLAACAGGATDSGTTDGADGADGTEAPEDLAQTLPNPGAYGVGYTTSALTFADPVSGEDRSLYLAWWYPSSEDTAEAEILYRTPPNSAGAVAEAPPLDGTWPVVVFSHGHQAFAEASGRLMAHFASHGWLVVAPDHTDNTFTDGDNRTTEIYAQRPLDVSAVLDHLEAGGHPLADQADLSAVVAVGHSFGGYTLFALAGATYDLDTLLPQCEAGTGPSSFCSTMTDDLAARLAAGFSDDRVDAWMPMAPGDQQLFGEAGLGGLSAPVLLLSGDLDPRVTDNPDRYWAAMDRGEHRHVVVAGGGHQTFTDYSEALEVIDGLIDKETGWALTHAYTLAFARRHALGDEAVQPVLDGELEIAAEATVLR